MSSAHPGSKRGGRGARGLDGPGRPDAADVNFDEILSALDTDTRSYLQLLVGGGGDGLGGQGATAVARRSSASSRPAATSPGSTARCAAARRTSAARSTTSGCWPRRSATRTTSSRRSSTPPTRTSAPSPPRTRACARRCGCCPARSARRDTALDEGRRPRRRRSAPTLGALRPAARALGPTLRQRAPVPRRHDAGHPRPAAAVRARRRSRPCAICARPPRDLAVVDPAADHLVRGRQRAAQRARLQPARLRGGLPVLDRRGLNHAGASVFATQDAHGPIRRGLVVTSCSSLALLQNIGRANQVLGTLAGLLNPPAPTAVCPGSTRPPNATPLATSAARRGSRRRRG